MHLKSETLMNNIPLKDQQFTHWKLASDIDNVLWLSIDRAGERVNSLSLEILAELELIVTAMETEPPAGLG